MAFRGLDERPAEVKYPGMSGGEMWNRERLVKELNVEHSSDAKDPNPAPVPTGRQKVLMDWFAKNRK